MYLYSGDASYLSATLNVANKLGRDVRTGSSTQSVWPDRVLMDSGKITSEYGAHWVLTAQEMYLVAGTRARPHMGH
jgi:hypothetical protein